jgi:putative DNA primase/helicase
LAAEKLFPEQSALALPFGDITFFNTVVTIWPRNDEAGRNDAKHGASSIIADRAAIVRIADVSGLPVGWDLGDDPPPGVDLRRLFVNAPGIEDAAEIGRLARLEPLAYDREKKVSAKRLGVGVGALDRAVRDEQRAIEAAEAEAEAAAAAPMPIEPWKEPVDGAALVAQIAETICGFIAIKPEEADAVALWIVGVHCLAAWNIFPRLLCTSPAPESGKTTLLNLVSRIVPRPRVYDEASPSSIYRSLDENEPATLLLDELDHLPRSERLRRILNSGHRRHKHVALTVQGRTTEFPTFAPAMLCLIGRAPDTIVSRSIHIRIKRRRPDEAISPFDERDAETILRLTQLARQAARWSEDHVSALRKSRPSLMMSGRARDNWSPLIAVADAAEGAWPERARRAAAAFAARGDKETLYGALAHDLRTVLAQDRAKRLSSAMVAGALVAQNEQWEGFTKNRLAIMLGEADVRSKPMKIAGKTVRGYDRTELEDFVARYDPIPTAEN